MPRYFSDRIILEFVEHAYAAGCDPREWQDFVTHVHREVPGVAFTTHLGLDNTTLMANSASAGFPPEFIESYLAHYHTINPYTGMFQALREGKVYTAAELITRDWLERQVFYQEWLKPAGNFGRGASVVLARDSRRLMRVSFDIPDGLEHLEPECAVLLERLAPHLTRAFELNEQLEAAVVAEQVIEAMLRRIDGAAVLVARNGRVAALNAEAERLAQTGTLFRIGHDRRLVFRQPAYDEAWQRAFSAAINPMTGAPNAFSVEDAYLPGGIVNVLPLRPAAGSLARSRADVHALLIARPAAAPPTSKDLLRALYGLTNAEAEIVMHLSTGTGVAEAAERLGISVSTARNQLAAAMAKTGVHRQSELVAAVAALAPRLTLRGGTE